MIQVTTLPQTIKTFILEQFLPDEDPEELTDATDLVGGGIMDSLATLKLVSFLEESYNISIDPRDMNMENLRTIDSISTLVESKL